MKPVVSSAIGLTVAAMALSMPGLAFAAPTPSVTPSATPAASATPTRTPSAAPSPSATATRPATPRASATPTPSPSPKPTTPQATLAIAAKYAANPWLGAPIGGEFDVPGGKGQAYANGTIFFSPATGAHYVRGMILARYADLGQHTSFLGLPTSDEYTGPTGAKISNFQHGQIIYTDATGAHPVGGMIQQAYAAHGYESGPVGAPTSGEFAGQGGAIVQRFVNGLAVYSTKTGANIVQGEILRRYAALGFEGGALGKPTSNEYAGARGARISNFEHGQIIWSADTGAHAIYGAIGQAFAASGYEGGALGKPVSGEYTGRTGARVQNFQYGMVIWTPQTGAHAVHGAILDTYGRGGYEGGPLGAPTSPEYNGAAGSRVQNFQFGQIIWSQATGAHAVWGMNHETFAKFGYEGGPLGLPLSSEYAGANGARNNNFQRGMIIWTPRTGSFAVMGRLLDGYRNHGFERGALGAPTTNEFPVPGGHAQDFERGRLTYINGVHGVVWPGPNVDARCRTGRVMCISKAERKLRWMIDGRVIKEMDARFGAADTPTREGQFQVFSKVRDEVSYLYGNTPMPFAMYFSGGEAVHYSYDFARYGYSKSAFASHGCVNIRDYDGIQWLYDTQVRLGDKVVVYW